MSFYNRYLSGETASVYTDIYNLKDDAFLPENIGDIEKVLTETFERVAYNLDILFKELLKINYLFKTDFEYNSERPLAKPLIGTNELLEKLDATVTPFGFVPLSLKMFYRLVGACNFAWDHQKNEDFIWNHADPIQIVSLDDLVSEQADKDYQEVLKENYEQDGYITLPLSADYFHKDNTSGGEPYSLQITSKPSIDSQLLFEEHGTTFVNYLRISMDNCGFSRMTNPQYQNDYKVFFDNVKPRLKLI